MSAPNLKPNFRILVPIKSVLPDGRVFCDYGSYDRKSSLEIARLNLRELSDEFEVGIDIVCMATNSIINEFRVILHDSESNHFKSED